MKSGISRRRREEDGPYLRHRRPRRSPSSARGRRKRRLRGAPGAARRGSRSSQPERRGGDPSEAELRAWRRHLRPARRRDAPRAAHGHRLALLDAPTARRRQEARRPRDRRPGPSLRPPQRLPVPRRPARLRVRVAREPLPVRHEQARHRRDDLRRGLRGAAAPARPKRRRRRAAHLRVRVGRDEGTAAHARGVGGHVSAPRRARTPRRHDAWLRQAAGGDHEDVRAVQRRVRSSRSRRRN